MDLPGCNSLSCLDHYSGHFTRIVGDSSFCDYPDLFKFCSLNAKESRHLDDLVGTYEIRGLGAEFLDPRSKLTALHGFRDVQTKVANALLGVM